MTIICGECGARNDDDSDFCASCGEPLEWTAVRPQEETAAPAAAAATAVVEAPPAAAEAPPAPAAEAPPAPAAEAPPAAPAQPEVAPPPAPEKRGFGRKAKTPPPPPPAATPPPVPPPVASAPPVEAPPPVEETPAAPVEAPPAPPSAAAPPDVPAAPPPRVPPPRRPVAAAPPTGPEDEEAEAARREAEEQARREELARRLVVPVEREPEAVPVPEVVPVVAPPPPEERLTWWQRLVRWFKRVILRQKPAAATAAVAAPVAAQQAPTATAPAAEEEVVVASRAPGMQKPGEEYVRREKTRVEEDHPEIKPGDLVCTQCGSGNAPTNKFCKRCGHSLSEAPVAQKPSWWKRFIGFFSLRKKRQYAAGERKKKQKQQGGGKGGGIFWRLQGMSFKTVGIIMLGVAALGAYAAFGGTLQDRFTNRYHQIMRLVHPSYTAVRQGQMTAHSSSVKGPAVGPKKAIDGKCNTVWITKPNAKGGVGSALTITFNTPIRLGVVVLKNGDLRAAKDCTDLTEVPAGYDGQSRVKKAKFLFFNKRGSSQVADPHVCKFKDNGGKPQNCKFGHQGVNNVGKIRMVVTAVYAGTKGKSVAVTEAEPQTLQ